MQTEGERLRYYIESKGVSIRKFCGDNGILYTSLHPILKNSRPLGINILKKIMESCPNLNVNWVLTGKGDVEINPREVDALKEPSPVYGNIDPGYEAFLKYLDREVAVEKIKKLIDLRLNKNEVK
jgi:transcriptional regulator with XRE-family HTH domain